MSATLTSMGNHPDRRGRHLAEILEKGAAVPDEGEGTDLNEQLEPRTQLDEHLRLTPHGDTHGAVPTINSQLASGSTSSRLLP